MTTEKKTIPIAYVTKWATTSGILVVRDGDVSEGGYLYCGFVSVSRAHWTDDKSIAENRWRAAMFKAAAAAAKKAERLKEAAEQPPPYTER